MIKKVDVLVGYSDDFHVVLTACKTIKYHKTPNKVKRGGKYNQSYHNTMQKKLRQQK